MFHALNNDDQPVYTQHVLQRIMDVYALLSAEARRSTDGLQKYMHLHRHMWLAATGLSKKYRNVLKI